MPCRRYPLIDSPCPRLPAMRPDAPSAWCSLCRTTVHNLSALSPAQSEALLSQPGPICVSYRVPRRHLTALAAGALLLTGAALGQATLGQDLAADEAEVLDELVVTGGGLRRDVPPLESIFLEEQPAAPTTPSVKHAPDAEQ